MCQLLILQPSWVGSTPSACHQGPHCPPSFLLPHPLTIWTKPPFNNKKPDYEAKDRKENKGHNEKGGKSLPNVALAAQDSTDRRTQLPHTTSLPATCSSCLCAIFLPLMSESLPLPKTQATLSPLPLQKGWSGSLCKQTEAQKPKNHTDTKATASWDSWNHSQCKLGRKCSLPTKAAFLCRGAGARGGQVCRSWGTWEASVRGSMSSVGQRRGRYLPDKGPTRPSATLANAKSSSSNQSATSQSREHDKAKTRPNSPVPCCPDSLKKKVSFRGTSWKVFLQ